MGITKDEHNGVDVTLPLSSLSVRRALTPVDAMDVHVAQRVGINVCAEWPLRFYIRNCEHVSRRQ